MSESVSGSCIFVPYNRSSSGHFVINNAIISVLVITNILYSNSDRNKYCDIFSSGNNISEYIFLLEVLL